MIYFQKILLNISKNVLNLLIKVEKYLFIVNAELAEAQLLLFLI